MGDAGEGEYGINTPYIFIKTCSISKLPDAMEM
jgi:hypothetical protein